MEKCAASWRAENTRFILRSGIILGWVRVEYHADHDWLDLLVVAPEHQRRGTGAEVLGALLGAAERRGVPLWLSVHRENAARRLYARLGFAELPRDDRRVFMVHPRAPDARPPR